MTRAARRGAVCRSRRDVIRQRFPGHGNRPVSCRAAKRCLAPPGGRHMFSGNPISHTTTLLYAARGVRGFADGFAIIILPAYLSAIGFDAVWVGVVATASLLGSAGFAPAGWLPAG